MLSRMCDIGSDDDSVRRSGAERKTRALDNIEILLRALRKVPERGQFSRRQQEMPRGKALGA